jgi:hypothetical protein
MPAASFPLDLLEGARGRFHDRQGHDFGVPAAGLGEMHDGGLPGEPVGVENRFLDLGLGGSQDTPPVIGMGSAAVSSQG